MKQYKTITDITLVLLILTPLALSGCDEPAKPKPQLQSGAQDLSAPRWPEDATQTCLSLSASGGSEAGWRLAWSLATDDRAVSRYALIDPERELELASVDPSRHDVTLPAGALSLGQRVHIVAFDLAENSSSALEATCESSASARPELGDPPAAWPSGARLEVSQPDPAERAVMLSWPALSGVSPITYHIYSAQGARLAEVTDAQNYLLTELREGQSVQVSLDAIDARGDRPALMLSAEIQLADLTAPEWPSESTLRVSRLVGGETLLTWPAASDASGHPRYEISVGEQVIADRASGQLTWIDPLGLNARAPDSSEEAMYSVIAIDESGNRSAPLSAQLSDIEGETQPLHWPEDARLVFTEVEERSAQVRWPAARGAVTSYQVSLNGSVVGEVNNDAPRAFTLSELTPLSRPLISVVALGADGAESAPLTGDVELSDSSAPVWPEGATLRLHQRAETALVIAWDAAADLTGVTRYHVSLDGAPYTQVSGSLWTRVEGLAPWSEHTLTVSAEDRYGAISDVALELTARTADDQAPSWPNQASLEVSEITERGANLSWPAAQDQVAVTRYHIYLDEALHSTIDAAPAGAQASYQHVIDHLSAWREAAVTVTALDAAGGESAPLSASFRTLDFGRPTWPEEATLDAEVLSSTSAELSWPSPLDEGGVARFEVYVDGELWSDVSDTPPSQRATLRGLRPGATLLIDVFAIDNAANRSAPLSTSVVTPDGAAPRWPEGAELIASAGVTEVRLSWPVAIDDVGVTGYRLFSQGEEVSTFEVSELEHLMSDLYPEHAYRFELIAFDASGRTSPPLSASVTTGKAFDPGFRRLSQAQLLQTLADLHGEMWTRGCTHPAHGASGCFAPRSSADFYANFTQQNWGVWLNFRQGYPADEIVRLDAEPRGGFKRHDQLVYPEHVSSWFSAVKNIANEYEGWVGAWLIVRRPCEWEQEQGITQYPTTEAMHRACLQDWVSEFGRLAFRRPLTNAERDDIMEIYDEVQVEYASEQLNLDQRFARALSAMMVTINLQPEFLYHVEVGDEAGDLTAFELANRLSYHFWNTMPDAELFAAAEDGSIFDESVYAAQVARLFQDPRALRSVEAFYRDYFRVQTLPDLNAQDGPGGWSNINHHAGPNGELGEFPYYNNTNGANSRIKEAMSRELINLGSWFTHHRPDRYESMFRSNLHFLECSPPPWDLDACTGAGPWSRYVYEIDGRCESIADCVEMGWSDTETGWDGVSEPIELPEPERVGLVTRMAMLSHDTLAARPIRRGLNIREILLCDPVPPPENCDVVKPPAVEGRCVDEEGVEGAICKWDPDCAEGSTCVGADAPVAMTVREKVEELTEQPGTSCAGCHSTFINGFGHALNHFSSVGQYWDREHMFTNQRDGDGDFWWFTHTPDQWREIDDTGVTLYGDEWVTINGAQGLSDFLVNTGQLEWCWSREYFRYTMGRLEWEEEEATIEGLADLLRGEGTLADAYQAIAHTSAFRSLYKPPTVAPSSNDDSNNEDANEVNP